MYQGSLSTYTYKDICFICQRMVDEIIRGKTKQYLKDKVERGIVKK